MIHEIRFHQHQPYESMIRVERTPSFALAAMLAIFDLVKKQSLSKDEEEAVRKVAGKTLVDLKEGKLKVVRWRESTQVAAQVKTIIFNSLQWLPQASYDDNEVTIGQRRFINTSIRRAPTVDSRQFTHNGVCERRAPPVHRATGVVS